MRPNCSTMYWIGRRSPSRTALCGVPTHRGWVLRSTKRRCAARTRLVIVGGRRCGGIPMGRLPSGEESEMTDSARTSSWAASWTALPGERFGLGEGLRLDGEQLIMVDILSGRLLRLPPGLAGPPPVLVGWTEPLGALAGLPGGGWIAAAGTGIALLRPGAEPRWLARPEDRAAHRMRMNDGAADPQGRFWAG